MVQASTVTPSQSVVGAFCGSSSSRNIVWERCGSVLWLQQQQKQRPGALQERSVAPAAAAGKTSRSIARALQEHSAALTASGSVAKTFCGSSSHRNSVQEHCRNVGSSSKLVKSEVRFRCCQKLATKRFASLGTSLCKLLTGESFLHKSFMVGCFARALYNLCFQYLCIVLHCKLRG